MQQQEIVVTNEHGLHARPAALFVQAAARFVSHITVRNSDRSEREINAKSIMDVLTAGVNQGSRIQLMADGPDEDKAIAELTELLEHGLR